MKINILIDNHLPVAIENYALAELDVEAIRGFLREIAPARLTAFAYGHDGWAQYPSALNAAPPGMPMDLLGLWKSLAAETNAQFAIYVSTLRNDLLLQAEPYWQRFALDGTGSYRVDHTSPYWETWLKPVLEELISTYEPTGFFFDGDYWTVGESLGGYRGEAAREVFPELGEDPLPAMTAEQHRRLTVVTYEQYLAKLAAFLAPRAPASSVNLAFTFRHPAVRPAGLDLITSDLPPFFAALDCWLETAVTSAKDAEREVVVPLFVEPEGGGRKLVKPLPQLIHEVAPILAMGESLHFYFPLSVTGRFDVSYAPLITRLRDEVRAVAPHYDDADFLFAPDVFCLSDSERICESQDLVALRGSAMLASLAGLNFCIAPTSRCLESLPEMRLLIAPLELSPSAAACVEQARAQGVRVLQRDDAAANMKVTRAEIDALKAAYAETPANCWADFDLVRPLSAFVRMFRKENGDWRIFVYNGCEIGSPLGRRVLNEGAGYAGRVSLTAPAGATVSFVEGYVTDLQIDGPSVSFGLDGAFAIIEGKLDASRAEGAA